MERKNILIIQNDLDTIEILTNSLQCGDYEMDSACTGEEGLQMFEKKKYHLLILDIVLPGISGLDVLKKIRETSEIPIIVLTTAEEEWVQLISFDYKADQYIIKPVSPAVMEKRVCSLIDRFYRREHFVKIGRFMFDFDCYSVFAGEERITLTTKEFEMIKVLYENRHKVLAREGLLKLVFGNSYEGLERTMDTHVKNIRKKLSYDMIITVKGIGYKLGGI